MSIAIVGGGAMGEAVVAGLVRTGSDAIVIEKRAERAAELTERYGVSTSGELGAIGDADTVLLVVKPQDADAVTREIAAHLAPGAVVVSLAAGISAGFLEARLPGGAAVVRVMPNTPALVGEGMAAVSRGAAGTAGPVLDRRRATRPSRRRPPSLRSCRRGARITAGRGDGRVRVGPGIRLPPC